MLEATKRVIRIAEVKARTGKSRTAIYREMASGEFPKNFPTGQNTVGWLESEIDQWIDQCIEAARGEAA